MIYKGLSRVGEIADVKAHGGADVAEVYGGINEANPIYYKTRTLTGTSPLSYKALSKPLSDYLISGNTVQDGTPTPSDPVNVVGCGVRTGNLFDAKRFVDTAIPVNGTVSLSGNTIILSPIEQDAFVNRVYNTSSSVSPDERSCCIPVSPETEYTIIMESAKKSYVSFIGADYSCVYGYLQIPRTMPQEPFTFTTPPNCTYIVIRLGQWVASTSTQIEFPNIMLVEGSEVPSEYIPYGYKLPLTVNNTEYPIYLGQVPTTRRIRELVLTGEEIWTYRTGGPPNLYYLVFAGAHFISNYGLCTHYLNQDSGRFDDLADKHVMILFANDGTKSYIGLRDSSITSTHSAGVSELKEYLAAQYAAGTPVIIWYVLATPPTGIVNEPLHKIGDYADTVSMAQAGVTIPTIAGANTLTVDTTVQPSEVSITGNIKEVSR